MGIQVTSPFKSSGRKKALMEDSLRFQTLREDITTSHMGPGTYDAVASYMGHQIVNPTLNDRTFRSHRMSDKEDEIFRRTLHSQSSPTSASEQSARPWRDCPIRSSAEHHKAAHSPIVVSPEQLRQDILDVRGLPDYL